MIYPERNSLFWVLGLLCLGLRKVNLKEINHLGTKTGFVSSNNVYLFILLLFYLDYWIVGVESRL